MICCSLIALDNMVECVILFAMIDLSRSCVDMSSLICYLFIVLMIYFWIKLKLKVLIYIQQLRLCHPA